jgi:hypothetical protein
MYARLDAVPVTVVASEAARAACTANICLFGWAMASAKKQDTENSVNSARLASLLDKLVAVHLDLEPLCGRHAERPQVGATPIAEACDVLQSAIADLRNIICQLDGLTNLPQAADSGPI